MKRKNNEVIENKVFENITFGEENPADGVYEECRFIHCNLNTADLSAVTFRNCTFDGCDLSLAKLNDTSHNNYSVNPETNRIRKARFSFSGLSGLLDVYDIEIE